MRFANRHINESSPVFIVVEAGTTSNGDLDTALGIIDAASFAGADAVKFMIIDPDYFMSDHEVTYEYQWAGGTKGENMYQMFKGLMFTPGEWHEICDYCSKCGIIFYVTVDHLPAVNLGEELGSPAYKLSSWDCGNLPLVKRICHTGKLLQIDTGPTSLANISTLLEFIRSEGENQVLLTHCSHGQTEDEQNLRSISFLKDIFGSPVGYSADTRDIVPDLTALALGAKLIEKRLTLNKNYEGHHHIHALEPAEFKEYVSTIRRAESMLGQYNIRPSEEDLRQKKLYYVSVVADMDIPAGTALTSEMLACKRPGNGIQPAQLDLLVGRTTKRHINRNELISWNDV